MRTLATRGGKAILTDVDIPTSRRRKGTLAENARERQHERVEALAETLADYYRQSGSWSGLRARGNWREFREAGAGSRRFGRHLFDPGDHGEHRERGEHEQDDHERDDERHAASGLAPTLLDAGGARVVGPSLSNGPNRQFAAPSGEM